MRSGATTTISIGPWWNVNEMLLFPLTLPLLPVAAVDAGVRRMPLGPVVAIIGVLGAAAWTGI